MINYTTKNIKIIYKNIELYGDLYHKNFYLLKIYNSFLTSYNKNVGGDIMKIIKGDYTTATIYADILDETTESQIKTLLSQEFMKDTKVRIMADCHAGAGCVIGTTLEIKDKIVPNLVGVDIGCGMLTVKVGKININFKELDDYIHENIPSGMNVNEEITKSVVDIEKLRCFNDLTNTIYLKKSIGSLGGGNHFIEIDRNDAGEYYLVIHSGSRNLGKQVAEIYQNKAILYHENMLFNKREAIQNMISEFKATGRQREIQAEINRISAMNIELSMPKELCYLEGNDFNDYMFDMDLCQKFASENRYEIAKKIISFLGLDFESLESFETIHNYINMKDKILRKGSISAYKNEIVLIPMNMRDGCIIGRGKSNSDYNYSAPHGAGRVMARGKAFKTIQVEDFKKAMEGIFSTTVNESTLDESPFVYKPMESILNNIKDTVDIIEIIKPVYNFKAAE